MPIYRKILKVGDSQAVTIPKSWLQSAEIMKGKKIVAIAMEVDGTITLNPVFETDPQTSMIPAIRTMLDQQKSKGS
jgi:antitoxin component of MazEF toxin-antitoxin module